MPMPGVLGQLEPILLKIKDDCPDTKAAIEYARRIVKLLQDLAIALPSRVEVVDWRRSVRSEKRLLDRAAL